MGLLGDIYSTIDTKKRQLKGLLGDFGGTVDMGVRRFREDQQSLQNLFANAYPMAGDKTVLNSPQQIAQFQREAADTAANMGMAAATVWHGSPHKFDKFDSSKIGTGEGAQAYGHGLYLAESPKVAAEYQAANMGRARAGDGFLETLPPGVQADAYNVLQSKVRGPIGEARLEALRGQLKPDQFAKLEAAYKGGDSSLYKVDLPDEHIAKMLDWDKPLSQQQEALDRLGTALDQSKVGDALGVYKGKIPVGRLSFDRAFGGSQSAPNGSDLYRALAKASTHDEAASLLRQQGIPGIRYLDGGSRSGGAGTSNFVVFPGNEGLLSILERNGQPLK